MDQESTRTVWFDKYAAALPNVAESTYIAITGTTSGTGFVAAKTAAEKGATVLLLNRKSSRSEKSLAALKEAVPDGTFIPVECDLQDFESVRAAAVAVKEQIPQLNVLCNNAGVMMNEDVATKDGYDVQMQTNHLSHFLLTTQLYPLLLATAEAGGDVRIVQHSSEARKPAKAVVGKFYGRNGGNLGGNGSGRSGFGGARMERYVATKFANVVFAHALHAKLQASSNPAAKKIKSLSAHPGVSATGLGDDLMKNAGCCIIAISRRLVQSRADGAMGIVLCMLDADAVDDTLYGPNGCLKLSGPAAATPTRGLEEDPENMAKLWKLSEEAVGPFAIE